MIGFGYFKQLTMELLAVNKEIKKIRVISNVQDDRFICDKLIAFRTDYLKKMIARRNIIMNEINWLLDSMDTQSFFSDFEIPAKFLINNG